MTFTLTLHPPPLSATLQNVLNGIVDKHIFASLITLTFSIPLVCIICRTYWTASWTCASTMYRTMCALPSTPTYAAATGSQSSARRVAVQGRGEEAGALCTASYDGEGGKGTGVGLGVQQLLHRQVQGELSLGRSAPGGVGWGWRREAGRFYIEPPIGSQSSAERFWWGEGRRRLGGVGSRFLHCIPPPSSSTTTCCTPSLCTPIRFPYPLSQSHPISPLFILSSPRLPPLPLPTPHTCRTVAPPWRGVSTCCSVHDPLHFFRFPCWAPPTLHPFLTPRTVNNICFTLSPPPTLVGWPHNPRAARGPAAACGAPHLRVGH